MKLDWREWIREIAVGGLTGAAGGGVAALWTNQPSAISRWKVWWLTGVFAIGFTAIAASKGYTAGELYGLTFPPTTRGTAAPLTDAIVVGYIVAATQTALIVRRRMSRR